MKVKARTISGLSALVAALALAAAGGAAVGPPVVSGHGTFPPSPGEYCGIDGTFVGSIAGLTKIDPTGATMQHGNILGTFTSSVTGKSIVFHTVELEMTTAPVDNGDGTLSFVLHAAGLIDTVKVPNGPPLQVIAGERDILVTVDAATGYDVSLQWLHTGGASGIVGCDVIVPALT